MWQSCDTDVTNIVKNLFYHVIETHEFRLKPIIRLYTDDMVKKP